MVNILTNFLIFISFILLFSIDGVLSGDNFTSTKDADIAIENFSQNLNLRRCCEGGYFLKSGKTNNSDGKSNEILSCINDDEDRTKATIESEDGTIEDGECKDGMFKSFNFGNEHFANTSFKMPYIKIEDSNKIVVKNLVSQKIEIDITDQHYCIGVESFNASDNDVKFRRVLKYCPEPCGGKEPCIRTCLCGRGFMKNGHGSCEPMSEEVKQNLSKTLTLKDDWHDENDDQGEDSWLDALYSEKLSRRDLVFEIGMNLTEDNFELVNQWRRGCRDGQVTGHLQPNTSCKDQFTIGTGDFNHGWRRSKEKKCPKGSDACLHIHEAHFFQSGEYPLDEFCVDIDKDNWMTAEVCKKDVEHKKYKFYPVVLCISCIFLLVTIFVYTKYDELLNHYTRIMRHFAIAMFFAFFLLIINMTTDLVKDANELCILIGVFQLYWFLTAFNLMTIMSIETYLHLRRCIQSNTSLQLIQHLITPAIDFLKGFDFLAQQNKTSDSLLQYSLFGTYQNKKTKTDNIRNHKKYRIEIVCCYCLSAMWTIFVLIAEATSPVCAPYQPRFGEVKCSFSNRISKAIWFFVPIGLLLMINLLMFVLTSIELIRLDYHVRKRRQLKLQVKGTRREMMERFLVFIKLSFGMGLIWTMEIVSGVQGDETDETMWYFTDILNMLQGVVVFLIFVCKRDVYEVIFKRKYETLSDEKGKGVELSRQTKEAGDKEETETLT